MIYLFVDNFRGFERTYFPICDVNFLVGENSTGKTSILGLIKLLSSMEFWFSQKFSIPDIDFNFGHFKDIVSVHSNDRSYFRVGLIQHTGKKDYPINAFLMTFKKSKGLPHLSRYTFCYKEKEFTLRLTEKSLKFKHADLGQTSDIHSFIENVFTKWIDSHRNDNKGYSDLSRRIGRRPALFETQTVLEDFATGKIREKPLRELRFPDIPPFLREDIVWLAPIRTQPRRTYDEYKYEFSPEGAHTPYLIKRSLDQKKGREDFKKFLEKVGVESGLFDSLFVKTYGGRSATAPFQLDVILKKKPLNILNVGYGVSQSLPVIVELFTRSKASWFIIQQPEIHLHPRAQAFLGDLFFELAVSERKKFFVETHADFAIDRFRLNYLNKDSSRPKAQILFFERGDEGNSAHQLEIAENGKLPDDQPKGYREFFIRENMKLLDL